MPAFCIIAFIPTCLICCAGCTIDTYFHFFTKATALKVWSLPLESTQSFLQPLPSCLLLTSHFLKYLNANFYPWNLKSSWFHGYRLYCIFLFSFKEHPADTGLFLNASIVFLATFQETAFLSIIHQESQCVSLFIRGMLMHSCVYIVVWVFTLVYQCNGQGSMLTLVLSGFWQRVCLSLNLDWLSQDVWPVNPWDSPVFSLGAGITGMHHFD